MSLVADSVVIAKRNMIKVIRVPDVLVFTTMSPIMFVLLFRYVFGSAIPIPGISYADFLIPGIFAQTVVFGATWTGASLAEDLQKGLIERFRSLPMSRSAVLIGRTFADQGNNLISIAVMGITGYLVGWRINSSFFEALAGVGLLLMFAYSVSWIMAMVGLLVRTPAVFNNAAFMVIFPLTFIANTFVPIDGLAPVLRVFAEWNPVSSLTQACRELFGNTIPGAPRPSAWSLQHPVAYSLIWMGIILMVFIPLSVRQYVRAAGR